MPYLIGTDEAGYGPNLGPLTVSGTLWKVPDLKLDLYHCLQSIVTPQPVSRNAEPETLLHLADSKSVYAASKSIESLERGVLALLYSVRSEVPVNERDLLRDVFSKCVEDRVALMAGEHCLWSPREPFDLPLKCSTDRLKTLGEAFSNTCKTSNVSLMDIHCRPVFPSTFNRSVRRLGNKAELLSSQTMQIVSGLLNRAVDEDVLIICDKHGGRSRYLPLIQQHLTQRLVNVEVESREVSRYQWSESNREMTIQFSAKGESHLPVALASMVSKYVREIFMSIWNEFWTEHVAGLKPTKGYPVDAKRFMADIEKSLEKLGISRSAIWRER